MTEIGDNSGAGQLRSFIDRVMRLKEEQDAIGSDIKEVYAEAKATGFDKTAMGQLVAYLRKKDKDADKLAEQSALFDLYLDAYERPSHAHTREGDQSVAAPSGLKPESAGHSADASTGYPKPRQEKEKIAATIPDEPAAATDTAGDYLREPAAVVSGQIIREGDAPRETDHHAGEQSQGDGDASSPDTDFQPPAFLAKKVVLRPHCLEPHCCRSGTRDHCHHCKKAMASDEEAA